MRVAIVRLTAMGDIIHTMAALQFVKKAKPDIELTWFVEEKFAAVVERNPHVDTIVPVDLHRLKKGFSFAVLRQEAAKVKEAGPFDLVIDVQGLLKSAILARIAGKEVAGLDFDSAKEGVASFLYSQRFAVDCARTAPLRFATLIAKALGIEITEAMLRNKEPYLFFDRETAAERIGSFFDEKRKNILVVTAASNASKTYPAERFIELIDHLADHNILLVAGSEAERKGAEEIAARSHARLLPPIDLDTLKYGVSRCDLLIGGDTGPSHMAWALNRPSLLLFGSTPRSMMMETPINRALTSGAKVHPCRFDKSDRSIATIDPAKAAEAAARLLG
ncbi:lipopolysaccharide heptosyltransferase I [Hydrogenimonas sp.]